MSNKEKEGLSVDAFEYAAPQNLQDAVVLLAEASGEARPLAGGTDLIAQMKENRRSPALVVDVKKSLSSMSSPTRPGSTLVRPCRVRRSPSSSRCVSTTRPWPRPAP